MSIKISELFSELAGILKSVFCVVYKTRNNDDAVGTQCSLRITHIINISLFLCPSFESTCCLLSCIWGEEHGSS